MCLEEDFDRYFERFPTEVDLGYMLHSVPHKPLVAGRIPAVLHADGTARVQVVTDSTFPWLAGLLRAFKRLTGVGVLVNTSFNGKGEPLVNTAADAYSAYRRLGLDFVIIADYFISPAEADR